MLRKFTNKELSEIEEIQYAKKVLNEEGAYSYQNEKYVYFYNNNKELIRIDNNLESKMENYYELNEFMKEIYEKTYKEYKSKKMEDDVMIMLEKVYKEIKRKKGLQTNTTLTEDMINATKLLKDSFKKINEECNITMGESKELESTLKKFNNDECGGGFIYFLHEQNNEEVLIQLDLVDYSSCIVCKVEEIEDFQFIKEEDGIYLKLHEKYEGIDHVWIDEMGVQM
ncbi:hypothetical protein [Clostridium botulinum]|uniref:Uncharacterized protein n=1 Tax=Clostridium botulinum (strain Langeland / NCTC 10281 / Type F) TaxID=441772 RepID=A7GEG4_CLOBL|nr:hypothetical protein [Clostridium botulinum]ABS41016.1 hypothetical protein CLI_1916 [Clostridium botulinum F str. Langeland]ADF99592.1 hypothetical protein CBF_1897 [Clostridium botulinum F str. 230613]KKM42831.1 hypothetical protein VT72_04105 [Clostridium botulinum]MBY6791650.1 hypothetical protein [Clostridium botulinum]MBY6936886.1 hypothetical protein [Clostridium botulinum]